MSTQEKQVRLLRVFVSSPGDVRQERDALEQAVSRMNRDVSRDVMLQTFTWEQDVVPHIGPSPQQAVDLQTREYDIYIGIMSARFGTPTGQYGSGTEKEFRDAAERWGETGSPRILFYFNDAPEISSDPEKVRQYLQVCQFRQQLQTQGIVGNYRGVRGTDQAFYDQVLEHLRRLLNEHFAAASTTETDGGQSVAGSPPTLDIPDAYDLGLSIVLGDALQILTRRGLHLQSAIEEKFRQHCLSAIEREIDLEPRFDLGVALGHLGDPRVAPDVGDEAASIEIPAGSYVYGARRNKVKLRHSFRITRFPVTNSQYELFLRDDGYENAAWWSEEGWQWLKEQEIKEPLYWRNAKWNNPDQPVVGVSYWEAEAFATWAGGRLPTEKHWEVAARGPDGCEYPWGDEWEGGICNSIHAGLDKTSPVGLFPRSRSKAFKLEDMAGNVWEWCSDFYDPKTWPGGRVLRGGSWGDYRGDCRAADRGRNRPEYRNDHVGFRVLFSRQDS